jgi:hypothetical protein
MARLTVLFGFLVQFAAAQPAGSDKSTQDNLWNSAEAKRAGLTMQAALFERKAALAAALVEM